MKSHQHHHDKGFPLALFVAPLLLLLTFVVGEASSSGFGSTISCPTTTVPWTTTSPSSKKVWGSTTPAADRCRSISLQQLLLSTLRGGEQYQDGTTTATPSIEEEPPAIPLDEKVRNAMIKLGLPPPSDATSSSALSSEEDCEGGVCRMPTRPPPPPLRAAQTVPVSSSSFSQSRPSATTATGITHDDDDNEYDEDEYDEYDEDEVGDRMEPSNPPQSKVYAMAQRIAKEMNADEDLVFAAFGATSTLDPAAAAAGSRSSMNKRIYHEEEARQVVQQELDRIATVNEESDELTQLIEEGFDPFLARRALAFADSNLANARAILNAELDYDEQEEEDEKDTTTAGGSKSLATAEVVTAPKTTTPPKTSKADDDKEPSLTLSTSTSSLTDFQSASEKQQQQPPPSSSVIPPVSASAPPLPSPPPPEQALSEASLNEEYDELTQLIEEGFDPSLARRALAFADSNLANARAILHAELDSEDEEDEVEDNVGEKDTGDSEGRATEVAPITSKADDKEASVPPGPSEKLSPSTKAQQPETPKASSASATQQPPTSSTPASTPLITTPKKVKTASPVMKTVQVKSNFDPTKLDASPQPARPVASTVKAGSASSSSSAPKPARKEDVVFEATSAQIQELVLESPVPVLLDVYADWCGPCKVLGPALEDMAIKSGGLFRLVKVNSDNERAIASTALEVTALPTVFGITDGGKIKNMFQGMPRSQEAMTSFMTGLMVGESYFRPKLTAEQKEKFAELTSKLVKVASSAAFPFSARERLQDRLVMRLDELAQKQTSDFVEAEEAASTLKALLSNIIRDPYSLKFRTINLNNKVIQSKVAKFPACLAILRHLGFVISDDKATATVGANKTIINVAPLMVARDGISSWTEKSRAELAAAMRHRRDLEDKKKLQLEKPVEDDEDEEEEEEVDPDACTIKVRLDGKKKVHELSLRADDTLESILQQLPDDTGNEEVQITCVAKRLIVKSSDSKAMTKKTLRDLGLVPSAALVVKKLDSRTTNASSSKSALAERVKAKKNKKTGSHTMQSIGIYAKDDNAKAELIDGGGGTWYEHDVSDDEEEGKEEEVAAAAEKKQDNKDSAKTTKNNKKDSSSTAKVTASSKIEDEDNTVEDEESEEENEAAMEEDEFSEEEESEYDEYDEED